MKWCNKCHRWTDADACPICHKPTADKPAPNDNRCMKCGAIIPEGRHICLTCERGNDMQTFQPSKKSTSKNYWIRLDDDFNVYKFLCCGFEFSFDEGHPKENGILYCPHCGVKMEN